MFLIVEYISSHKLLFIFAVVCPNITTISNGIHNIQTNGTVTFSRTICAEHYEIVGTSESYCQLDGSWSNETPSCSKLLYWSHFIGINGQVRLKTPVNLL